MAKSKAELIYDIENELVDPITNKITGERVKARLLDMVGAMSTGGGQLEYWNIEGSEISGEVMLFIPLLIKGYLGEEVTIVPASAYQYLTNITAIAVDQTVEIYVEGIRCTIKELLENWGTSMEAMGATKIDKDAFYTI